MTTTPLRTRVFGGYKPDDRELAREGVRAMLRLMGANPDTPDLVETPDRWVRAYLELGVADTDVADILHKRFMVPGVDSVVSVGPITFVSLCEHHLLPFTGEAWVAYKPDGGQVVGLSKLPRLVQHFARRPQVQERMTEQVTTAIMQHLPSAGAGCVIRGEHSCMTMRGIRAVGASMVTSSMVGIFRDHAETRQEFLDLTRGGAR